jgi:hypothetical protein
MQQCNAPARRRRQRLGELGVLIDGRTQRCEVVDDLCARVSKRRAARGALLQLQRGKRSTPAAAASCAWRRGEALPAVTTRRTQLPPAAAAPILCRQLLTLTFGMPMKPMHLRPVSRMSCARTRRSASGSAAGTLWRWKSASGAEALRVSSVAVCGRHGVSLGLWQQQ